MATTTADNIQIIGGVDTHQDLHTAAVVSHDGTVLGTESFSTTRAGYRAMLRWFRSHGELLRVGVESTGTYGAGITRHLALSGIPVLEVTGGVDTHQDLHTAAVVSHDGTVLGTESFSTTRAGYRAMLRWFRSHGELLRVGVESTGTYGAGITRHLALSGIPVLEVTGPDPASRRAKGKDDALDAISAAEAARTRRRVQVAKDRSGSVEALRVLRTTRKTAIKCRRAALQQLYNTIVAAPEEVRDQVRNLTRMQRLRTCAAWRPDTVGYRDPVVATKLSLKSLARRILDINDEIAELDRFIVPLVEELAPSLLELEGVGTENAGAVMVAVGDNPDRLRSEASFAMMCGVCPIPASSGKTQRHRLNRGGNRQANSALHMVVVCRMRTDERTRAYVARRTLEGLSKREIMRCLKRYVAREIYRVLTAPSSA